MSYVLHESEGAGVFANWPLCENRLSREMSGPTVLVDVPVTSMDNKTD